MPVHATDVDQPFDATAEHDAEPDVQDAPDVQEPDTPPQSPKQKRGRPAGSKDKQPRRRPVCADVRPVTRRSAPRARRNVCRSLRVLLRLLHLLPKSRRPGLRGIASASNIAIADKTCTKRTSTGTLLCSTECWHNIKSTWRQLPKPMGSVRVRLMRSLARLSTT